MQVFSGTLATYTTRNYWHRYQTTIYESTSVLWSGEIYIHIFWIKNLTTVNSWIFNYNYHKIWHNNSATQVCTICRPKIRLHTISKSLQEEEECFIHLKWNLIKNRATAVKLYNTNKQQFSNSVSIMKRDPLACAKPFRAVIQPTSPKQNWTVLLAQRFTVCKHLGPVFPQQINLPLI